MISFCCSVGEKGKGCRSFESITLSVCEPGSRAGWGWRLVWDQSAAGRAEGTSGPRVNTAIWEELLRTGYHTTGWWRRAGTGYRSSTVQWPAKRHFPIIQLQRVVGNKDNTKSKLIILSLMCFCSFPVQSFKCYLWKKCDRLVYTIKYLSYVNHTSAHSWPVWP